VELFADHAREVRSKLLEGLAAATPFEKCAADLGLSPKKPVSFTLKDLPPEISPDRFGAFLALEKNGLSEFILTESDLLLWYVQDRQMAEVSEDDDEVAALADRDAATAGTIFLRQLIEELIMKELTNSSGKR
jgi:hypothetical protein